MKQRFGRQAWLLIVLLLCTGGAFAQFSSSIEGTVTDATGAIVPGAKVVLTGIATGVTSTTESNSAGFYKFPSLGPGSYRVTVTVQGFAPVTEDNVDLTAMQTRDVSLKLQLSSVTTSVEVEATPTAVETDEATISTVTDQKSIEELPIQGRNLFTVANQTPGVTGTGLMGSNSSNTDIFYATTTPAVVANGGPNHGNTYLLDGVSLDDSPSGGDSKLSPNPDSIQEVVVSTTNYSAEFGKAASLVTQITSKAGTNKFHGSAFEDFQANYLTARTEFQSYDDPLNGYITPYTRNEFGGSVGGPVRKDKTFFFGSLDVVRAQTTSAGLTTVEDPAFTSWLTANLPNNLSTTLLSTYKAKVNPTPQSVATVAEIEKNQGGLTGDLKGAAHNCADTVNDPNGIGPLGMPCNLSLIDTSEGTSVAIHDGYQYNARIDQSLCAIARSRLRQHVQHSPAGSVGQRRSPKLGHQFPQDAWFGA